MSKSGAAPNVISPPAGNGFVSGLGEAFSLDLNTGQGTYSLPLELPQGIAGWAPKLKLEYVHGAGHGPFGLGWRLPVRRIDRRLDFGVPAEGVAERFLDTDVELVPVGDGLYRAAFESAFNRYERSGEGWVIVERNGARHELGLTEAGRESDPEQLDHVQTWLLERTVDLNGNAIEYAYEQVEGTSYLREIRYAVYAVRLIYDDRPDVRRNGRAGFPRLLTRRAVAIEVVLLQAANERKLRTWALAYDQADFSGVSLLASVQLTAHGAAANGADDIVRPSVTFGYTGFTPDAMRIAYMEPDDGGTQPPPLTDPDVALLKLDDLPLPGLLSIANGRQVYWPNRGDGRWGAPRPLRRAPNVSSFRDDGVQFLDLDGNGAADMLVGVGATPLPGYYRNDGDEWGAFVAYPRGQTASPPWRTGRVRLGDLDGDGLIDALYSGTAGLVTYLNHGEQGWAEPTATASAPDVDFRDPLVFLADMTGDGQPDLVRVRSGQVVYWPNLGYGRFGQQVSMVNSPRLGNLSRTPSEVALVDIDGDGCADVVRVSSDGIELVINQSGQRFADPVIEPLIPPPLPGTLRVVDMSGRGTPGLLWNSLRGGRVGYVSASMPLDAPAYLLTSIDNGSGLVSEIHYRAAIDDALGDRADNAAWDTYFPFPMWVVAETRETDAITAQVSETHYRYHDGHFNSRLRRFLGFRRVERRESGDTSRADVLTIYHFLMDQDRAPGHGPQHAYLDRLLARTEVFSLDGAALQDRPLTVEESDYDVGVLDTTTDGRQRVFTFVRGSRKRYLERSEDERVEERSFTYDDNGNVTREILRASGTRDDAPVPELQITTEVTYATNPDRGIVDAIARVVKRDADGRIIYEMRTLYDGDDFTGLPFGEVERRLMSREEQLVLPAADFAAHYAGMDATALGFVDGRDADGNPGVYAINKRAAYTAAGNVAAEMDALGNVATITYDDSGLFRTARTDELGTTTFAYDPTCGKQTRIESPDGAVVEMRYDALGRLARVALGGDSLSDPTRLYTYDDLAQPAAMRSSNRINAGARQQSATYYSGAGKECQKRVEREPAVVVVSGWIERNPWGQTRAEYEPTLATSLDFAVPELTGRQARRFVYDAEGRPVNTTNYNGGVSTATYRPFEVITFDANDTDDSQENRDRGQFDTPRRSEVDALNRWTVVGDVHDDGQVAVTRYRPGLLGELLGHDDDAGAVATYSYDLRGLRLRIDHRNAGERRLWYNAAQTVIRTLDPRGNDIEAAYDAVGRLARLTHNGVERERYTYDDEASGGWGRLTQVSYADGEQRFAYDGRGLVARQEYRFAGHAAPFTMRYEYDGLGNQSAVTYPDGTTIRYERYRDGTVRRIPGFVEEIIFNARNLLQRIRFANGVTTEVIYSPGSARVQTQRTTGPTGQSYEDASFLYDRMQLLLSASDAAPDVQSAVSYAYDPLYQLTRVNGSEPGGAFDHAYRYASAGNLLEFGESGATLAYTDPARPDHLTGIAFGGGATMAVPYDNNGNVTALPGRVLAYSFKNELVRVERDDGAVVAYGYDHRGRRVRKTVTAGVTTDETLFLGNAVEVRNGQMAQFVTIERARIALVTANATRFLHPNPLGSATFFTDEAGTKIAQIAYLPFGNVRTTRGSPATRTFALHEFDSDAELYYMGRRWYAPEVGRFTTPDPLALYQPERAVEDPRSRWLYTYAANDPMDKVDPNGLSFWSVVGAIVGVAAGIALGIVLAPIALTLIGVLVIVGIVGLVTVSYMLAQAYAGTGFGEFMRGFMIGLNAGLNAAFATAIFGIGIGVALGVINFLAAFDSIANSEVYQGILGWSSWLMPMSWLVTGLGLAFFVINVVLAGVTFNQWDAVKIHKISVDWETGTLIMEGGAIRAAGPSPAFNMGNVVFLEKGSTAAAHEIGHTLNLAAFGSIFHFVGAIDENITGGGAGAFAEQLAESNDPSPSGPIIPMWV